MPWVVAGLVVVGLLVLASRRPAAGAPDIPGDTKKAIDAIVRLAPDPQAANELREMFTPTLSVLMEQGIYPTAPGAVPPPGSVDATADVDARYEKKVTGLATAARVRFYKFGSASKGASSASPPSPPSKPPR